MKQFEADGGVAAAVGLTRGAEQPAYTLRSAATDSVMRLD